MKKCNNCKINFNTKDDICPLCQNKLIGTKYTQIFPNNIRLETTKLIYKLIIFLSIISVIICSFIELYLYKELRFTKYVIGGVLTNLVVSYYILKEHQNLLKMFTKYGLVIVFIIFIWFLFTKEMIISNYIIPSLCILELIFNITISIILKNNYIIKYLNLILINIILSSLPIILILFNLVTNKILSFISCLLSLILLIGLLLFYYEEIVDELKKIFNI